MAKKTVEKPVKNSLKSPAKKLAKKPAKKAALTTRGPHPTPQVPTEWRRAVDDIASAIGVEEIAKHFSPFGTAGRKIATSALRVGASEATKARNFIIEFVPEAIRDFEASHPPCPVRSGACRRLALLEAVACFLYEEGHVPNPTVEFQSLRRTVDKYIRSLS